MTTSIRGRVSGTPGKLIIIGGGITGLCAAVYARRCGYDVELLEQHSGCGGLATSWQRNGYTFETCLHWLLGSKPGTPIHRHWQEVFDIDRLQFVYAPEFARLQTAGGDSLSICSNPGRMESELIRRSPADAAAIRRFAAAIRRFTRVPLPDPSERWPHAWLANVRVVPYLPLLHRWMTLTIAEYGKRFHDPLIRSFFDSGETAQMSAVTLGFALAWTSDRQAGYPIGGSQAVIRLIQEQLLGLGGRLHLNSRVERILVEHDAAAGVQLASGESVPADRVLSAADGHLTIYGLLGGRYLDPALDEVYRSWRPFPSYLQVSLGVALELSELAGYSTCLLEEPLRLDPATQLRQLSFRCFHFDPTFAPPGRTAVTCFLPTYAFDYWLQLRERDPARYQAEKQRVADAVISVLEALRPGARAALEVIDVSTPATVIRTTGNWHGSMEGWLLTPHTGFRPLRNQLPGLRNFFMAGQWVAIGGGLPGGLLSARAAVRALCEQDGVPFLPPHHTPG